ncbi:hypothetical protein I5Q34_10815 [Streptomyces sp. AV19]|nr:hypothetical protein [Streptomyces sp. AV19]
MARGRGPPQGLVTQGLVTQGLMTGARAVSPR